MTDKRCGTCGFGQPLMRKIQCHYVVPKVITQYLPEYMAEAGNLMRIGDGTNCPCWKPKEATDATDR